jgi:hypothetical protein
MASVPPGKNGIYVEANVTALDMPKIVESLPKRVDRQPRLDRQNIDRDYFPLACRALPVSGKAAALPTSPMNSQRVIRSTNRRRQAVSSGHEAESFRRLEIDHKLEFGRRLHRKIRRLRAAENAPH